MSTGVLIVDDSAVVRQVLGAVLAAAPGIEVLPPASDPLLAMDRMRQRWPDVIVLDIEMPRMDGLTFLRKIMAERPTPVVICSSSTADCARKSMEALAAGAVAVIGRPRVQLRDFIQANSDELVAAVRAAAGARVRPILRPPGMPPPAVKHTADVILSPAARGAAGPTAGGPRIVAIGTSTGGTQALEEVLTALPADAPPIVVVQHMPPTFTAAFAERLNSVCTVTVKEAANQDRLQPGTVLIAPGGRHMLVRRSGTQHSIEILDGPLVSRHRPSVDVLFRSVAKSAGAQALGIIMTGMGDDGAAGLLEMRHAGAATLAQDERSCVVYGMPKEAVRKGGVERSVPLGAIAHEIATFGARSA